MGRFLGVCCFLILSVSAIECEAQRHRGWFKRRAIQQNHLPSPKYHSPHASASNHLLHAESSPPYHHTPGSTRFSAPRDPRYHWQYERYPKYIGGFHSSHFSNIGVPSGDIGFRGNGIYWTPW